MRRAGTSLAYATGRRPALAAALGVLLALTPREVRAQASHRLAPVGGRTTLVGGTGLVFGRDSASAFLNPATVVRTDSNRLAFSVNFYQLSIVDAPRWYQPGAVDRERFGEGHVGVEPSVSGVDFDSLPGSLCVFLRIADIPLFAGKASKELRDKQARLGLCLASVQQQAFSFTEEDYEYATPAGTSRQAKTVRQTFRRVAIGPTYAMYITNALAVGASLHFGRSSHRSLFGTNALTYGGPSPVSSAYLGTSRGDSHDLTASFGATYRISPRQTVAVAIELPSLHLFGGGGLSVFTQADGAGSRVGSLSGTGSFVAQTPLRIGIGTGIEQRWGSAELNVSMHMPTARAYEAELSGRQYEVTNGVVNYDVPTSRTFTTAARGAVNLGVGGEVFLNDRISVLGGLGTDVSIAQKGTLSRDLFHYFPARTHRATMSFGVGSHGEGGDLLLGAELAYGWGERLAVNAYQLPPRIDATPHETYSVLFVLAGSTSFRSIKRAVDDVTNAIGPSKPEAKADKEKKKNDTGDPCDCESTPIDEPAEDQRPRPPEGPPSTPERAPGDDEQG